MTVDLLYEAKSFNTLEDYSTFQQNAYYWKAWNVKKLLDRIIFQ